MLETIRAQLATAAERREGAARYPRTLGCYSNRPVVFAGGSRALIVVTRHARFSISLMLGLALAAAGSGTTAAAPKPPVDPAIAQYVEQVPTAEGSQPSSSQPTASTSAARTGGSASPPRSQPAPSAQPGRTTPVPSSKPGTTPVPSSKPVGPSPKGQGTPVPESEASDPVTAAISSSDTAGGLSQGAILAIVLSFLTVCAVATVFLRRRVGR